MIVNKLSLRLCDSVVLARPQQQKRFCAIQLHMLRATWTMWMQWSLREALSFPATSWCPLLSAQYILGLCGFKCGTTAVGKQRLVPTTCPQCGDAASIDRPPQGASATAIVVKAPFTQPSLISIVCWTRNVEKSSAIREPIGSSCFFSLMLASQCPEVDFRWTPKNTLKYEYIYKYKCMNKEYININIL